jgi:hypothetical protein
MRLLPDTRSEIDEPSRVTSLITELRSTGNGIFQPPPELLPCAALKPLTNSSCRGVPKSGLLHLGPRRNRLRAKAVRPFGSVAMALPAHQGVPDGSCGANRAEKTDGALRANAEPCC